jgi:hypothetical protein
VNLRGVRLLDGGQQLIDLRLPVVRGNEQMHVLGHEHERDQAEIPGDHGRVDRAGQLLSPCVVREQVHPPVAGECELVQIARLVEVLDSFA